MAVLWVNGGYETGLVSKIRRYTEEAEMLQSRYYKVRQQVRPYSDDQLVDTSSVYLQKRELALREAQDKAKDIQQRARTYVDDVIAQDISVSKSIHKAAYTYYKAKNIGPKHDNAWSRAWNRIQTNAKDFWHDAAGTTSRIITDIKSFYEEHKYVLNIVKDIIVVIGAVALFTCASLSGFGLVILIGAVWATSKALYETATDCLALQAWSAGDAEQAENLSNRTLTGEIMKAGEWLDNKLGTGTLFKTALKFTIAGLEFCELVASVAVIFKSVEKAFGLERYKSLDIRNLTHRSFKQSLYYARGIPKTMLKTLRNDPKGVLKGLDGAFKALGKAGVQLGDRTGSIIMA